MTRFLVFVLAVSLFAPGCSKSSGSDHPSRSASRKPETRLDDWSWLPGTGKHDSEVALIPKDSPVQFSIPENEPLKTDSGGGWGGISSDGEFVPRDKKSYFVRGGALVSKVGPVERKAKWGDWDFVYSDAELKKHAAWGNALTSGELILPRIVFLNVPTNKFVQNSFEIESFGNRFVLIRLDPAKGHKLVFLKNGNSLIATAGYIGSKAEVGGKILERKPAGWYAGTGVNAHENDLVAASESGDLSRVRALLANGSDANAKRGDGATALMLASEHGHLEVAKLLLAKGADASANNDGITPLFVAALGNHSEIADLLLANKADVNGGAPLVVAAVLGHKEIVELLLANKADVNAKTAVGATPLHGAAMMGHKDIVELLLENHADVNSRDNKGLTPLTLTLHQGHSDVARLLRKRGGHE
jgi:ankyrin repeat protein